LLEKIIIVCGICGKLNFDSGEPVNADLLRRMRELVAHRGPDGAGEYLSGPVGLGHRRLSIIDLNTGAQPMSNEDGTVWVVYNGEIYNFAELKANLEAKGHRFRSTTDTEVIVHLYEDLGEDCVSYFRGMFAFALWDERRQLLLLARDRVGIKPLYYAATQRALLFGSEIKSILADTSVVRTINLKAIDRFLTYYYLPGHETLFEGIYKLEPGHYLTAHNGRISVKQYWDLAFPQESPWKSFDEAVEALQELLRQTVKDHMISDVPVGVLLSGGVDSTGILRYAAEQTDKPIHTFTIGFSGADFVDERFYAKIAADMYGTQHHEITMTSTDFGDFLPNYVWHMEEPVCEPPAVALYFVSRLARSKSVKVLLSGEGGDEAFGGYQNYRNLIILERLKSTFGQAKGLLGLGFKAAERAGWKNIGRYSHFVETDLHEYYLSRTSTPVSGFNKIKHDLYTNGFVDALTSQGSDAPSRRFFKKVNNQSMLNKMLYVDTKMWLPDDLLIKADKMTMATSVELRVPLLDFKVLEFAATLPQNYKVRGWTTKRVLKAALAASVPREILGRKKTGFPIPYQKWLRVELKDYVHDNLLSQSNKVSLLFRKNVLADLVNRNQNGENLSAEIFSLLILSIWIQEYGMQ